MSGIQYCLKQHCQAAGVTLSCHRLRHTFGRRLAENGPPVDSLATLLGHSRLQTTQRYIDGADPTVRADFDVAMAHLETRHIGDQGAPPGPPKPVPPPQPRGAPQTDLEKLRQRLDSLPPRPREALDACYSWHWPTWRAQTAYQVGSNLICLVRRVGIWLSTQRQVDGWESLRRADLEAWLQARCLDGVADVTIRNELAKLACFGAAGIRRITWYAATSESQGSIESNKGEKK